MPWILQFSDIQDSILVNALDRLQCPGAYSGPGVHFQESKKNVQKQFFLFGVNLMLEKTAASGIAPEIPITVQVSWLVTETNGFQFSVLQAQQTI